MLRNEDFRSGINKPINNNDYESFFLVLDESSDITDSSIAYSISNA